MSAILKGVQETTGCEKRACMKQQVPLNKDRFLHKCELGNGATYQNLIYSLLPFYQPPYRHLCICGSVYSTMRAALSHLTWYAQGMGSATNHAHACVGPSPPHDRNKVSYSALGAGRWAHGAMLDGCSTLSSMSILLSLPTPLFLLFPCSHLLIRFSASAEWVKHNYHTYVRGKKVEYKVIKEKR